MEDEKIVLDKETFKALAVDSRVDILKELDRRRKTQSELAEVLDLSVATVKEHLDKMDHAGLLKQKDEGRKWKYYELTEKGRCVLYPERKKIWIILASLVIVAGLAMFTTLDDLYFSASPAMLARGGGALQKNAEPEMMAVQEMGVGEWTEDAAVDEAVPAEAPTMMKSPAMQYQGIQESEVPWLRYTSYGLTVALLALFVYYFSAHSKNRKRQRRHFR